MKSQGLFALLAWIAVCGAAFAQSGGLEVFPQAVEMQFPQGYDVYSDAGKLVKTVSGPTSATVQAKTFGKTFAAGEAYLSDWSYGQLQQGKSPNWIAPKSNVAAAAVTQTAASVGGSTGLVVYPAIKKVTFPDGYSVFSDDGQLIKTVPGPTSIALKGETNGKTFANGTAYLSDWSYDQLQQGKSPHWIVGSSETLQPADAVEVRSSQGEDTFPNVILAPQLGAETVASAAAYLGKPDVVVSLHGGDAYASDLVVWERKSGRKLRTLRIDQGAEWLFPAAGLADCFWVVASGFTGADSKVWLVNASSGRVLQKYDGVFEFHVQHRGKKQGMTGDTFWSVNESDVRAYAAARNLASSTVELPEGIDGLSINAVFFLSDECLVIGRINKPMVVLIIDPPQSPSDWSRTSTISSSSVSIPDRIKLLMQKGSYSASLDSDLLFSDDSQMQLSRQRAGVISVNSQTTRDKSRSIDMIANSMFAPTQVDYDASRGRLVCVARERLVMCDLWSLKIVASLDVPKSILSNPVLTAKGALFTLIDSSSLLSAENLNNYKPQRDYSESLPDANRMFSSVTGPYPDWSSLDQNQKLEILTLHGEYGMFLKQESYASDSQAGVLHGIIWGVGETTKSYGLSGVLQANSKERGLQTLLSKSGVFLLNLKSEGGMPDLTLIDNNTAFSLNAGQGSVSVFCYPRGPDDVVGVVMEQSGDIVLKSKSSSERLTSIESVAAGPSIDDYDEEGRQFVCLFNAKYQGLVFSGRLGGNAVSRMVGGSQWSASGFTDSGQLYVASRDRMRLLTDQLQTVSEWKRPGSFDEPAEDSKWAGINRWSPSFSKDHVAYAAGTEGIFILKNIGGNLIEIGRAFILGDASAAFVTADGYFSSPAESYGKLSFTRSVTSFPIEQFDLRLNRPDIVLERLGAPADAVAIARQLREKRLKRMGVTEEMLKPDFHVPDLDIVGDVPTTTDGSEINLSIKASDSKYPLERLKVFVNNVPVNGRDGELLRDESKTNAGLLGRITSAFSEEPTGPQSLERTIPIKLAAGRNKIQLSVLNNAGAESLYANAEVNCTSKRPKPTLYAVAMGVSDYSNPDVNLKYAAKDARDILQRLKTKAGDQYGEVKELLITDKEVTKGSIETIREFLNSATIDDTVLMFVAGHGLLDSNYDYYFGTTDIDFNNPSDKGIAFEEFDDLLAELPSLKKSLLIDTCHAGELDEEEKTLLASAGGVSAALPTANGVAVRSIGTRGMNVKAVEGARGASEWYDRLQGLFVDLRRGSGSTILSSSAGAEYALESSEQQNGLFTYAVLEALDGKKDADTDKDGSIEMSELGEYVKKRVSELTNNKQTPNTRRVNLEGDFTLAKTK